MQAVKNNTQTNTRTISQPATGPAKMTGSVPKQGQTNTVNTVRASNAPQFIGSNSGQGNTVKAKTLGATQTQPTLTTGNANDAINQAKSGKTATLTGGNINLNNTNANSATNAPGSLKAGALNGTASSNQNTLAGVASIPSSTNSNATAPLKTGVGRGADIQPTGNVINVKPGDNIQSIIDQAAEGSTIHFAKGTYDGANINLTKKLTLDGEDGTIFDGGNQTKQAMNINKANGATVQDIDIRNYTDNGIHSVQTDGLTLQNLSLSAIGDNKKGRSDSNVDTGIMLDESTNNVVRNVTMDNIKNKGLGIGYGSDNLVENVQITNINPENHYNPNWDATAFKGYGTKNTTVRNSVLGNVFGVTDDGRKGGNAIWFDTGADGNLADGNTIVGQNLSDIYIETTLGAAATNNQHEDGNLDLRVSKKSGPGFTESGNVGTRREEPDYVTNPLLP
jgi:hypothetical protein